MNSSDVLSGHGAGKPRSGLRRNRNLPHSLLDAVDNPSVRPMAMIAQVHFLMNANDRFEATEVAERLRHEFPDFAGLRHLGRILRDASKICNWMLLKCETLVFDESDPRRFSEDPTRSVAAIRADEMQWMARRLVDQPNRELTSQQQLGRHFVRCQAEIDFQQNLDALLTLADERAIATLRSFEIRYPAQRHLVLWKLAEVGDAAVFADAVALYATAIDDEAVGTAVRVIARLAEPTTFKKLTYR